MSHDTITLRFSDISSVSAIQQAMPGDVLSPTLGYGEIKMVIAIMMITTGFVRQSSIPNKSSSTALSASSQV